jgi:hypothetical protein
MNSEDLILILLAVGIIYLASSPGTVKPVKAPTPGFGTTKDPANGAPIVGGGTPNNPVMGPAAPHNPLATASSDAND